MVHCMVGAYDAAEGLCQGAIEVSVCIVVQQAVVIHNFIHQDGVLGIAAAELEGVAGGHHGAAIVNGGLDGELIAGLILVSPLCADLLDHAAELVADDCRMLSDVFRNALVSGTLDGSLVAGHADGVGDDLYEDLVILDCGHFKGIETKVIGSVHANCFVQHFCFLLKLSILLLHCSFFPLCIIAQIVSKSYMFPQKLHHLSA